MAQIEELRVGQRAEVTRTVSDRDVTLFAEITGDANPVHLDDEAARRSPFGERIAHGMLTAGIISAVLGMQLPGPGTIYLSQSLRFTKPVRIGESVTASAEIIEVLTAKRRVRLTTEVRNQNGEVVLEGEAVVMVTES